MAARLEVVLKRRPHVIDSDRWLDSGQNDDVIAYFRYHMYKHTDILSAYLQ